MIYSIIRSSADYLPRKIEQPLDEKRLWLEAQHAENLDIKYLEQRIIAFTNNEIRLRTEIDNYKKREVVFKNSIEDLEADMGQGHYRLRFCST